MSKVFNVRVVGKMTSLIIASFTSNYLYANHNYETKNNYYINNLDQEHDPINNPALERNTYINPAENRWFEKIKISGLLLGEVIKSTHDQAPATRFNDRKSYHTFCFPRANLLIDANIDKGLNSHFSFNFRDSCGYGNKNDEWSFTKFDRTDEAYLQYNTDHNDPIYVRFGIQYMPYGNYKRHNIPMTLTQALTQIQAPGVVIGVTKFAGYQFSGFIFNGKKNNAKTTRINNFGGQISWYYQQKDAEFNFNIDGLLNMAGSVNYLVSCSKVNNSNQNPLNNGYQKIVPATAFSTSLKIRSWDAILQLTTALRNFDKDDLSWKGKGAKPGAFLLGGGYSFQSFTKPSHAGINYQISRQAVNAKGNNLKRGLPKRRLQADYTVEIKRNLTTGVHVVFDRDYKENVGGTAKNNLTCMLSVLLKLA